MVLVQLRLLPLYLRLRFAPGFWAFTFSWCAVAILALHWIELEHPAGQRPLAWLVGGAATVDASLPDSNRSRIAVRRGTWLSMLAASNASSASGKRVPS